MRQLSSAIVFTGLALALGCGSQPTHDLSTAPSTVTATPSATSSPGVLGFSGLTTDKAAVSSYSENGFTATMTAGSWQARTTYGNPLPFVQFLATPNVATNGEVRVSLGGPTYFKSVDLYSSTTPIPYVITGIRNSAAVFTITGNTGNTYGSFRTISNPNPNEVDTVTISLTNVSAASNPMGFDNLATSPTPAAPPARYALSGTVLDNESGAPIAGASMRVVGGPDTATSVTTDASGTFRFASLQEAGFSVSAQKSGYLNGSQTTFLSANQSLTYRLLRDPRAIVYEAAPSGATVIGFGGLTTHGAAFSSYSESGFTVSTTQAGWVTSTAYGRPAPFIQFVSNANTSNTRRIDVTAAGGALFTYWGSEVYSSTVKVPYTITGTRAGATVFTVTAELPNPTGNFRQVLNGDSSKQIDTLTITLTNAAAACCTNPVGIDNIVVIR